MVFLHFPHLIVPLQSAQPTPLLRPSIYPLVLFLCRRLPIFLLLLMHQTARERIKPGIDNDTDDKNADVETLGRV